MSVRSRSLRSRCLGSRSRARPVGRMGRMGLQMDHIEGVLLSVLTCDRRLRLRLKCTRIFVDIPLLHWLARNEIKYLPVTVNHI